MTDDDFPKLEIRDDPPVPSGSTPEDEVVVPEVVDDVLPPRPQKRAPRREEPAAPLPSADVRKGDAHEGPKGNANLFGAVFLGVFGGCFLATAAYFGLFGSSNSAPPTDAVVRQAPPTTGSNKPPPEPIPEPMPDPVPEPVVRPQPTVRARPTPPPTMDELTKLLAELRSGEQPKVHHAASMLARQPVNQERRQEVAAALLALANRPDAVPGGMLGQALSPWVAKDDIPALIKIVKGEGNHEAAIITLGNLQDAKASEALVAALERESDRGQASGALKKIGPGCERAVQTLVLKKDPKLRIEMCEILNKVGTTSSLATLQVALNDTDFFVHVAAQNAITAIKRR